MCGIMGYLSRGNDRRAWDVVMDGLKRLEYRGYDSAGIATLHRGKLRIGRAVGHLSALDSQLAKGLPGRIGIGHTRWATHGGVTEANCHPHTDPAGRVAVVHNGIVDNVTALRDGLVAAGAEFASETDTEVIAHLIAAALADGAADIVEAVRVTMPRLHGTAGLVVMSREEPERLVAARLGSPVVVGVGDGEMFVASDRLALVSFTDRVVVLDEGEIADITPRGVRTIDFSNRDQAKRVEAIGTSAAESELGDFADFMSKEIAEQPAVIERTLRGRLDAAAGTARLGGIEELGSRLFDVQRVVLLGAGTSLNCAEIGRHHLEALARLPSSAEDAAEFASGNPIIDPQSTLYIAVSQSGETADTLAAVHEIQRRGGVVAGVTNGVGSSLARATGCGVYVHAGPEISVCSTKAFTAQVVALTLFALRFGRIRHMSAAQGRQLVGALAELPAQVAAMLEHAALVEDLACTYNRSRYAMFIGRGASVAVAKEGALKLKEIAYIPSEGLSGAQMKHGPLALVDEHTPVWAIVPPDEQRDGMLNNMRELAARGARLFAVADAEDSEVRALAQAVVPMPRHHPILSPLLAAIPLQQYAYFCARSLGHNIDKPRNLAKSVTVL